MDCQEKTLACSTPPGLGFPSLMTTPITYWVFVLREDLCDGADKRTVLRGTEMGGSAAKPLPARRSERLHWHPQTFIQAAENRTHLGRQRDPRVSVYREDKEGTRIHQHRCLFAGQADHVLLVVVGDSHGRA